MPFSFEGFGPVAILIMVLSLALSEIYKYFETHHRHR